MFDLMTSNRRDMIDLMGAFNSGRIWDNFWTGFDDIFKDDRYTDKDDNIAYELECPGFNKDNLKVEINDGVLTIKGERGEGNRIRKIFKRLSVSQTDQVNAEIKDGILTIVFQTPETKKATKIDLK